MFQQLIDNKITKKIVVKAQERAKTKIVIRTIE
jgi:hypothetical protein